MKTVVTSLGADIPLAFLGPERDGPARAWIARLANWDDDPDLRARAHPVPGWPGVYYLKTDTDLRLFFHVDGDTITVRDVTTRQNVLAFSGA